MCVLLCNGKFSILVHRQGLSDGYFCIKRERMDPVNCAFYSLEPEFKFPLLIDDKGRKILVEIKLLEIDEVFRQSMRVKSIMLIDGNFNWNFSASGYRFVVSDICIKYHHVLSSISLKNSSLGWNTNSYPILCKRNTMQINSHVQVWISNCIFRRKEKYFSKPSLTLLIPRDKRRYTSFRNFPFLFFFVALVFRSICIHPDDDDMRLHQ